MNKIESFNPIIDENTRVLILGSMPGIESLKKTEYYGHKRNQFWRIIFSIFNEKYLDEYEERIDFLKKRKIGLWDVLSNCEREGSLDSKIKNEEVNDLPEMIKRYPNIKFIAFNGTKAYESFKKSIGFQLLENSQVVYRKLPSTSPTPGKKIKTFEEKLDDWKIILMYTDN